MVQPLNVEFTRSLAFIYFFLAQNGDADGLTAREVERIIEKVGEWSGSEDGSGEWGAEVAEIRATWQHFRGLTEEQESAELLVHANTLRELLPGTDQRALVIEDLVAVAQADGQTSEVEEALITYVREALGV